MRRLYAIVTMAGTLLLSACTKYQVTFESVSQEHYRAEVRNLYVVPGDGASPWQSSILGKLAGNSRPQADMAYADDLVEIFGACKINVIFLPADANLPTSVEGGFVLRADLQEASTEATGDATFFTAVYEFPLMDMQTRQIVWRGRAKFRTGTKSVLDYRHYQVEKLLEKMITDGFVNRSRCSRL